MNGLSQMVSRDKASGCLYCYPISAVKGAKLLDFGLFNKCDDVIREIGLSDKGLYKKPRCSKS